MPRRGGSAGRPPEVPLQEQADELGRQHGVLIRLSGVGQPLVVFPGMQGSGESCMQVIAKVCQVARDAACPVQLVLVDYAAENHATFDALVDTILKLLERNMGNNPLLIWGQSFANLLAIGAANSKSLIHHPTFPGQCFWLTPAPDNINGELCRRVDPSIDIPSDD
jgi:hypothetical protein